MSFLPKVNTSKLINQLRTAEYSEQEASDLKDIIVDIAQTNNGKNISFYDSISSFVNHYSEQVDTILQKQIEDLRISLQSDLKKSVKLIEASIYKSYLTAQKDNNCLLSPTKPLTSKSAPVKLSEWKFILYIYFQPLLSTRYGMTAMRNMWNVYSNRWFPKARRVQL